jgi:hypothetical protein
VRAIPGTKTGSRVTATARSPARRTTAVVPTSASAHGRSKARGCEQTTRTSSSPPCRAPGVLLVDGEATERETDGGGRALGFGGGGAGARARVSQKGGKEAVAAGLKKAKASAPRRAGHVAGGVRLGLGREARPELDPGSVGAAGGMTGGSRPSAAARGGEGEMSRAGPIRSAGPHAGRKSASWPEMG